MKSFRPSGKIPFFLVLFNFVTVESVISALSLEMAEILILKYPHKKHSYAILVIRKYFTPCM